MESPWGGALTFSIGGTAHEPPRPHFETDYWSPLESDRYRPEDQPAGVKIWLKFEHAPVPILVSGHRRRQPC